MKEKVEAMGEDNKIKIRRMFAALMVSFDTECAKSNPSAADFAIAVTIFIKRVMNGYGMKEEDKPIYVELINDLLNQHINDEKKSRG